MSIFKKRAKTEKPLRPEKPNAMIVCEKKKTRGFDYVKPEYIPEDSFERMYNGVVRKYNGWWLHVLAMDAEGNFRTIRGQDAKEGESPTDLFIAHNCAPEVAEVYNMSMPLINKVGLGILVALSIVIIIVIFLIVMTLIGGTHV